MLNLSALHSPNHKVFERSYRLVPELAKRKIPRRTMLAMSGGALGLTAAIDSLGNGTRSQIQIDGDSSKIQIKVGDGLTWVIDTGWFGGNPELIFDDCKGVLVSLKNALYPGTTLSADFSCLVTRLGSDWRMLLRLACADLSLTGSFTRWLRNTGAVSSVAQREEKFLVASDVEINLPKGTNLLFTPDFTLFANSSVQRMRSRDFNLSAQHLSIALLNPDTPTILQQPPKRRSLVSIDRGRHDWDVPLHPLMRSQLEAIDKSGLFDAVHFEVGETTQKISKGAMLFESAPEQPKVKYSPGAWFKSGSLQNFFLTLKDVKY